MPAIPVIANFGVLRKPPSPKPCTAEADQGEGTMPSLRQITLHGTPLAKGSEGAPVDLVSNPYKP